MRSSQALCQAPPQIKAMSSASTLLRLSGNLSPRMICPAICAVAICAIVILCNDRDSGGAVFQVHQFWAPMHPVRLRREPLSHAVDETRAIVHPITSLSSALALMSSSFNIISFVTVIIQAIICQIVIGHIDVCLGLQTGNVRPFY